MISPPILLTSSVIAMDSSVALKNESSRIFHTLESIHRWGCISPQSQFVICDGSGFDFTNLIEERFPHLQVECIHFMNDPSLVQHYGKGYGESEIIQYALMHSRVLKNANYFAKCTAKLWVDNFIACLDEWNGRFLCKAYFSNVFSFKSASLEYIDTRFYIVDKYFYLAKLANLYVNINSNRSESIEEKFLKVLLNNNAEKFLFRMPPIISGVGGGSGEYYNTSILRRIKEVVRIRLVAHLPRYKKFFNVV